MKKIISTTLIAILLSTIVSDTINAAIGRRVARRQAPRRSLPQATGKAYPQQVKQAAKQAERNAKKLQADVKKAEAVIKNIEQQLANLRSWAGDVAPGMLGGGYSGADKQKAMELAAPYIQEAAVLNARIKSNQDKIKQITTQRWFGYGTPTIKPGEEKKYAEYNQLIAADEKRVAILTPIIKQQDIIMGKQLSDAVKAAYGTMATIALTVTGLGIASWAGNTFATGALSNIAYYTTTPISAGFGKAYATGAAGLAKAQAAWNVFRGNTPAQTATQNNQESDTTRILEAAFAKEDQGESFLHSIVLPGLRTLGDIAREEIMRTLLSAFKAGARTGTNLALKTLYQQVLTLSENPNANPRETEAAHKALKAEVAKEQAKNKK